jgi:hypothetical protein
MELLGWFFLYLFYAGPYIIEALLVVAATVAAAWIAFAINRRLGIATVAVIVAGAGISGYIYLDLVQGPSAFNAACNSGTGVRVFKDVQAQSYVLTYVRNIDHSPAYHSDATVEDAISNVAYRDVEYVEVQDWNDASHPYGVRGHLAKFRNQTIGPGYFKIYVASLGSPQCRWLMPQDVEGLPFGYKSYLAYKLEHHLNARIEATDDPRLEAPHGSKQCVAVDYVTSPSAHYEIEFLLDRPISENVVKHEIRVVDLRDNRALIGNSVAYQHKADGEYARAAFWAGGAKRHPTCPINLLKGHPVWQILKVGAGPSGVRVKRRS